MFNDGLPKIINLSMLGVVVRCFLSFAFPNLNVDCSHHSHSFFRKEMQQLLVVSLLPSYYHSRARYNC